MAIIPFFAVWSGLINYTINASQGYMQNFWEMWKPCFGALTSFNSIWNYILIIPYIIVLCIFFRNVNIKSWQFITVIIQSMFFTLTIGQNRYRILAMLPIILFVGEYLTYKLEKLWLVNPRYLNFLK